MNAEQVAKLFHESYESLAPSFSYSTRVESAVPWEDVPENNRRLMIAVAGEVLAAIERPDADQLSFTRIIIGEIDAELQDETVYDDPYMGQERATTKRERGYRKGFVSGRIDAFSKFRRISGQLGPVWNQSNAPLDLNPAGVTVKNGRLVMNRHGSPANSDEEPHEHP